MPISLYDATIPSQLQLLGSVRALIDKAAANVAEAGKDPAALIDARLAPDMLPLGYQVKSCRAHSLGAIEGVMRGSFSPDQSAWPTDFDGLRALLDESMAALRAVDPAALETRADTDMEFRFGDFVVPFTGGGFLLSFAQPNFYFHATTAYAILRAQGVKVGKRDFLGALRLRGG